MTWSRALKETARSGLTIERTKLTPLIAVRGSVGVAIVIGLCLWLGDPGLAVSSAFGAFASGIVTFQRSMRPRPVLALAVAGGLAVSTFLGYLVADHIVAFLLLLAGWTFLSGMAWAIGPVSGLAGTQTVAIMLVTVTLPTSVLGALEHAALIAFGGLVQATLIVVFPVRPWGVQRDALADALAAEADYARRLRHDPVAPFDPAPLMDARLASAVTPRQAKRRPVQLHGPRGPRRTRQARPRLPRRPGRRRPRWKGPNATGPATCWAPPPPSWTPSPTPSGTPNRSGCRPRRWPPSKSPQPARCSTAPPAAPRTA